MNVLSQWLDGSMVAQRFMGAESLHSDDRFGLELCTRQDLLKVLLEALHGASTELAKEFLVLKKGTALA